MLTYTHMYTATNEAVHDDDPLQRVFHEVYSDTLFLTGVLPYNKKYVLR